MKCQIASIYNDAFQLKMQMILACTHASINECMYVHCMMITQNHNKLNNKKYNFIVVFARTPQKAPFNFTVTFSLVKFTLSCAFHFYISIFFFQNLS